MTKGLSKKIQGDEDGDAPNPVDNEEKSEKEKKMSSNVYTSNMAHVKLAEKMKKRDKRSAP